MQLGGGWPLASGGVPLLSEVGSVGVCCVVVRGESACVMKCVRFLALCE